MKTVDEVWELLRHEVSVREVVRQVEAELALEVPVQLAPRRAGDPPALVSDSAKARDVLGWRPRHSDLRQVVADAAAWDQRQRLQSVLMREATHAVS